MSFVESIAKELVMSSKSIKNARQIFVVLINRFECLVAIWKNLCQIERTATALTLKFLLGILVNVCQVFGMSWVASLTKWHMRHTAALSRLNRQAWRSKNVERERETPCRDADSYLLAIWILFIPSAHIKHKSVKGSHKCCLHSKTNKLYSFVCFGLLNA